MKMKTDFLLPVLLLFTGNSYALDWLAEPGFGFSERYSDNLRLLVNTIPHHDNFVSTISPSLMLGYIADDNELKTNFHWNQLVYHGESDLDYSEKTVSLNHIFQAERWKTGLMAKYSDESSLTGQLDVNGSGQISTQVPRFTKSIAPEFTYFLSEKDSLLFSYNYTNLVFGKHLSIGFSDYHTNQADVTLNHKYSQQLSLNARVGYSTYDAANNSFARLRKSTFPFEFENTELAYTRSQTTYNYQVGLQYAFTEKMTISANIGMNDVSTTSSNILKFLTCRTGPGSCPDVGTPQPFSNTGNTYSLAFYRLFEHGDLSLNANQQLSPASTGSLQNTSQINATANYHIDDRWTAGINGYYLKSEIVGGSVNSGLGAINRNLTSISPNIQWKMTQDINIQLSYSYLDQILTSTNQSANSNSLQLQFFYQPPINHQVK